MLRVFPSYVRERYNVNSSVNLKFLVMFNFLFVFFAVAECVPIDLDQTRT